jgi:hypothetical protein
VKTINLLKELLSDVGRFSSSGREVFFRFMIIHDEYSQVTSTRQLLLTLGFVPDIGVHSDELPGLIFNFGNFKLEASWQLNRWFVPIVLLSGLFSTSDILAPLDQQLPLEVESVDQGKAFVAWCLQGSLDEPYETQITPDWLVEGRSHFDLLPWKREAAAYEGRPRCYIRREWARVTLKELGEHVASFKTNETVSFSFDGEVLRIRCGSNLIVVQAQGKAWLEQCLIDVSQLMPLPKRLVSDPIEISYLGSTLTIGHRCYAGIRCEPTEENR